MLLLLWLTEPGKIIIWFLVVGCVVGKGSFVVLFTSVKVNVVVVMVVVNV